MSSMFLILSFFFPRITLFVTHYWGTMPPNSTPFELDVIGAILAPRLLIAFWTYELPEVHIAWTVAFIIAAVLTALSSRVRTTTTTYERR